MMAGQMYIDDLFVFCHSKWYFIPHSKQIFALEKLNQLVDDFWAEIADAVEKMWVYKIVYPLLLKTREVISQ